MSGIRLVLPAAVLVLATVSGCGNVRMVQSSPDGGIVALPSNSNSWPCKYRDEAEKLMAQKCPNGYEIVEEKEVPIGQRTTTAAQTITQTSYNKDSPSTTATVTSTRTQTEYRIIFKARPPQPILAMPPLRTTPMPSTTPVLMPVPTTPGLPDRPVPVTP